MDNNVREIVTKAIIAKGKKIVKKKEVIQLEVDPFSILGCWVINSQFTAKRQGTIATINGNFELDIWFSTENNSKTELVKRNVTYKVSIATQNVVDDYIQNSEDVIVRMSKQPKCGNVKISGNKIETEISFELIAEIIGETIVKVNVFNTEDNWDNNFINEIEEEIIEE